MKRQPESRSDKPSLECLLRLKREERPDADFWADFEVRMRQKQLAAIIEPKPWWLGATLALRRFSKPGLLVSSGAAAAFALVLLKENFPAAGENTVVASVQAGAEAGTSSSFENEPKLTRSGDDASSSARFASVDEATSPLAQTDRLEAASAKFAAKSDSPAAIPTRSELAALQSSSGKMAAVIASAQPKDDNKSLREPQEETAYGTVLVATNFVNSGLADERGEAGSGIGAWGQIFAALDGKDFTDLPAFLDNEIRGLGAMLNDANFGSANTVSLPVQPGSRFERLLSADTTKMESISGEFASVRDRVLHRLAREEELYASVSRVGVGGDRLSLRF